MTQTKNNFEDSIKKFAWNLATGGTAAAIAKTLNSPLEVAKLILQTQPNRYNGMVDLFSKLPREEGIKAFWAGNFTNVLRYFPTQALNFAFKDLYAGMVLTKNKSEYGNLEFFGRSLISGGLAGASSLVFVYPLDLARTRLTTDKTHIKDGVKFKRYNGLSHCLKETWKEGGIRALYRGFNISVAGIIPYRAVYFGGYDTLKKLFMPDERNASFWFKWLISQSNTIIAQFITYPIDTIRRTMMKSGEKDSHGNVSRTFNNSWEAFRWLLKTRGWKGIYKGSLANTYRATGAALCIVFYDIINQQFAGGQLGTASGA